MPVCSSGAGGGGMLSQGWALSLWEPAGGCRLLSALCGHQSYLPQETRRSQLPSHHIYLSLGSEGTGLLGLTVAVTRPTTVPGILQGLQKNFLLNEQTELKLRGGPVFLLCHYSVNFSRLVLYTSFLYQQGPIPFIFYSHYKNINIT